MECSIPVLRPNISTNKTPKQSQIKDVLQNQMQNTSINVIPVQQQIVSSLEIRQAVEGHKPLRFNNTKPYTSLQHDSTKRIICASPVLTLESPKVHTLCDSPIMTPKTDQRTLQTKHETITQTSTLSNQSYLPLSFESRAPNQIRIVPNPNRFSQGS